MNRFLYEQRDFAIAYLRTRGLSAEQIAEVFGMRTRQVENALARFQSGRYTNTFSYKSR